MALCLFAAVAVLAGVQAGYDQLTTAGQVNVAVNVVRASEAGLYARDPVFGQSGLHRLRAPAWQWYLQTAYELSGRADPLAGFRVLAGPLVMLYLAGMYLLLWSQTRSWSVSCFTAVLSTTMIYVPGGSFWGLGPLCSLGAEGVCLAMAPLLVWLLLRWIDSPHVLWVFFAVGLLANLHAVTATNFAAVLALTLLGAGRFRGRAWLLAGLGGLCAAGAASPFLLHYASAKAAQAATAGATDWPALQLAFQRGRLTVLYPEMLGKFVEFLTDTLILWILALVVMVRAERLHVRNLRAWLSMLFGAAFVGLVLHGASQLAGILRSSPPPVIDFARALQFVMLPLYVLFALTIVHLARMGIGWLTWAVRVALLALLAVWLAPAYNLRVVRHWAQEAVDPRLPEEYRLERVRERVERRRADAERRAIALWLRDHTPVDTVVAAANAEVRLWSHRALVASPDDVKYFYYLAPHRLKAWSDLVHAQHGVLAPPAGPADERALQAFAAAHGAAYVLVQADRVPPEPTASQWVTDEAWGSHWALFLTAADPAATEAAASR